MGQFLFNPNKRYRMPVLFGPTVGPRQGPHGETFDSSNAAYTVTSVSFLSDQNALNMLLPNGFGLNGEPVVTVEHTILHDLQWLAGRSYSMLGVKFPVVYRGKTETISGSLLTVLWENRPEPILSGREELGFNKVFCDLPDPEMVENTRTVRASWDGFEFFKMKISGLQDSKPAIAKPSDGTLHYAYRPPLSDEESHQDCVKVMLSPTPKVVTKLEKYQTGDAEFAFNMSTFEQLPTMFQIVNVLGSLPVNEIRSCAYIEARGKSDLSDQRQVR